MNGLIALVIVCLATALGTLMVVPALLELRIETARRGRQV
jgi:hypothetical protein